VSGLDGLELFALDTYITASSVSSNVLTSGSQAARNKSVYEIINNRINRILMGTSSQIADLVENGFSEIRIKESYLI